MPAVFVFELSSVRHILHGLRKLRETVPEDTQEIDSTICWLKHQIVGKIKSLEPFMRNRKWIEAEILYELNKQGTDFHECADYTCKKPCRGKFCVECWRDVLASIHGEKEHKANSEQCKCK